MVALGLLTYACCALSTVGGAVRNTAWAVGEADRDDDFHIYLGLSSAVTYDGNNRVWEKKWQNIECDDFREDKTKKTCKKCKKQVLGMKTTALVAAATSLFSSGIYVQRSTRAGDANCQKFMGVFTTILAFATAMSALSSFKEHCFDSVNDNDNFDMSPGPGFIAVTVAVVLKGIGLIGHLLLRVPHNSKKEVDDGPRVAV